MSLGKVGSREVATVAPDTSVLEVARRMEHERLGCVVVVVEGRPVGILTDRDLVIRVLGPGRDPEATRSSEVMSAPVHSISAAADRQEAATRMRERQVRRLPLVDDGGAVRGIVTLDDLLHDAGRMSAELAQIVASFPVAHFGG